MRPQPHGKWQRGALTVGWPWLARDNQCIPRSQSSDVAEENLGCAHHLDATELLRETDGAGLADAGTNGCTSSVSASAGYDCGLERRTRSSVKDRPRVAGLRRQERFSAFASASRP